MIGRGLRVRAGNRRFQMSGARVQCWVRSLVGWCLGMGISVFWFCFLGIGEMEAWIGNFVARKETAWEMELGGGVVGGCL
ncbi:Uncharacterized protein TCM_005058 [Theobroma cacao]|uniref:Uncharacterized protein n=1 Tax=Theobroma cacao TaxID=3641 RepID=A0A061DU73_THECC|nr:Uncharacterized protein TCM_005058 [Theobroma cacao]